MKRREFISLVGGAASSASATAGKAIESMAAPTTA